MFQLFLFKVKKNNTKQPLSLPGTLVLARLNESLHENSGEAKLTWVCLHF